MIKILRHIVADLVYTFKNSKFLSVSQSVSLPVSLCPTFPYLYSSKLQFYCAYKLQPSALPYAEMEAASPPRLDVSPKGQRTVDPYSSPGQKGL